MLWMTLNVALGGAIGAASRFLLVTWISRAFGTAFPLGVLSANVLGSFIMGLAVVGLARTMNEQFSPLLIAGILGGFTTFSAFSLEAVSLFERGESGAAAAYVGLSVVLSIAALILGTVIARAVFP